MNWINFNKVFEIVGATAFVLLAIARISHVIPVQTFLWSAVAMFLIEALVGRQVQGVLTKRIQELESRVNS
ncbi:MAG: hypothetical protein RIM99_14805 [Cyclobacteriaceae bacterium]